MALPFLLADAAGLKHSGGSLGAVGQGLAFDDWTIRIAVAQELLDCGPRREAATTTNLCG